MRKQTSMISQQTIEFPNLKPCRIQLRQSWEKSRPESWTLWSVYPGYLTDDEIKRACNQHFPILNLEGREVVIGRAWSRPAVIVRSKTRVLVHQDCGLYDRGL